MTSKDNFPAPPLVRLGQIVSTPGVLRASTDARRIECLNRHVRGDWGVVCEEDAAENRLAVAEGFRILSAYRLDPAKPCFGYGNNRCRPRRAKAKAGSPRKASACACDRSGEGAKGPCSRRSDAKRNPTRRRVICGPPRDEGAVAIRCVERRCDRRTSAAQNKLSPLRESCRQQEPPTGITSANATPRLIAVTGGCKRSPPGEERVSLDKVPALAKAAADKAIPGAHWQKAETEHENGKLVYELKGRDPKGKRVKVEASPDGNQVTVEEKVSLNTVPGVVKAAADKAIPGVTWKAAEQETEGGKMVYELKGHDSSRKRVKVEVSLDGKQVTVEH
jgi:uncharacterized membrane protein YkoI